MKRLKHIIENIQNLFSITIEDGTQFIEEATNRMRIENNRRTPIIKERLDSNGYSVISEDPRTWFRSFTIAKKEDIMTARTFTIDELSCFIGIDKTEWND